MNIPTLETERLILRAPRETDLEKVFEFHADPTTVAIYRSKYTRDEVWKRLAAWVGHWHMRGYGSWFLEEKDTHEFVGRSGHYFPYGWLDVEVGYGIHPKHRGRGYAVEAASFIRDYGYRQHGFKRLVSYIQPTNANSIRVAEKMGAVPDGTFDMSGIQHTVYLHTKH